MWLLTALCAHGQGISTGYSAVDLGDGIVLVRPEAGNATRIGLVDSFTTRTLLAEVVPTDFEAPPLFVIQLFTDAVTIREDALAFHRPINRTESETLGRASEPRSFDESPVGSFVFMNQTGFWDPVQPDLNELIFVHELGHRWMAYVDLDGPVSLLGRQDAHWSYLMATNTSPMDGNTWIDNGDGTYTSDPDGGFAPFSDLELYLMGLLDPAQAAPFWIIEPDVAVDPDQRPDNRTDKPPITIPGQSIEFTVDDVIAANGEVPRASDTRHEVLLLLTAKPDEIVAVEEVERVRELVAQWTAAWSDRTGGLSEVVFEVGDPRYTPPPMPDAPAIVPTEAR